MKINNFTFLIRMIVIVQTLELQLTFMYELSCDV